MIKAGRVAQAAGFIDPFTEKDAPTLDQRFAHAMRASIDVRRGRNHAATHRFHALDAFPIAHIRARIEITELSAENHLWCGRPRSAYDSRAKPPGSKTQLNQGTGT